MAEKPPDLNADGTPVTGSGRPPDLDANGHAASPVAPVAGPSVLQRLGSAVMHPFTSVVPRQPGSQADEPVTLGEMYQNPKAGMGHLAEIALDALSPANLALAAVGGATGVSNVTGSSEMPVSYGGTPYRDGIRMAGASLEQMPGAGVKSKLVGRLMQKTPVPQTFNDLPLYQQMEHLPLDQPAPIRGRMPTPPERAEPQAMPTPAAPASPDVPAASAPIADPIAPSAISPAERTALIKQGYTPQMIDGFEAQLSAKTPDALRGTLRQMPEPGPTRPPIQADASSLPESPLQQPRVAVGAEQVGRGIGQTKEQVRAGTAPILGEQQGEASPIFPQQTLGKITDALRALPPGGPERDAYVARAPNGKSQWQIETLRRQLEHLGLVAPLAVGGGMAAAVKAEIQSRLQKGDQ